MRILWWEGRLSLICVRTGQPFHLSGRWLLRRQEIYRLRCPICGFLRSHLSVCLMNAGRARWVSTAAMLIVTTVHAKSHLFCIAQSLMSSRKFPMGAPSSGLLSLRDAYYKLWMCEMADKQPCNYAGNIEVLLIHKLWMLNQIIWCAR